MTDVYRIGAKLFCTKGAEIELEEMIPIFHRWIQHNRLPHLLVDVADYSHVPSGPGILLVAHEGNYSFDEHGGRRGLTFYRKQPMAGTLDERLVSVVRDVVAAAELLAVEPEVAGRLVFSGSELTLYFNDRLHAPNTDECFAEAKPGLARLFERALGANVKLSRTDDPRERLMVNGKSAGMADLATLASRLAG